jgi:hypothetical protein
VAWRGDSSQQAIDDHLTGVGVAWRGEISQQAVDDHLAAVGVAGRANNQRAQAGRKRPSDTEGLRRWNVRATLNEVSV